MVHFLFMYTDFVNELRQMTTISKADIPLFAGLASVYLVYRLAMVFLILPNIGKALRVKRLNKFVHRTFDMIHYVMGTIIGVLALTQRPYGKCFVYAANCKDFFWQNPNGFELTLFEKIYYMLFCAYYTVDIFFIYTASEPLVILIHHIVTLSEVLNCVVLQSPVVGLSIMLLHDITDTPLYVGKFFVYIGSSLKDVSLVIFAISCTYFRIFNYPMIVWNVMKVGFKTQIHPYIYYAETVALWILYGLHLMWEYKIFQNVVEIVKGSQIHDNRSD